MVVLLLQLLLAGATCTFTALDEPAPGSCAGPTERAVKLREAYPNLPRTMCPMNQMAC